MRCGGRFKLGKPVGRREFLSLVGAVAERMACEMVRVRDWRAKRRVPLPLGEVARRAGEGSRVSHFQTLTRRFAPTSPRGRGTRRFARQSRTRTISQAIRSATAGIGQY